MTTENTDLDKLIDDREKTHDLVAELKAELGRIGADWVLLGNHLSQHPETIHTSEDKIMLGANQSLPRSELDLATVLRAVERNSAGHRQRATTSA